MIRKIILIILLFLQFGCGYKIANNSDYYKFQILSYELTGEKKINNILRRNFDRFKDNINSPSVYRLTSESSMIKTITSKDSSENVLSFKLEILIKLEIFENNDLISEISFSEKTDYNNISSKFELKQYEDILLQDLTNQLIAQINNHLSTVK
jgi:outer membrane lipopolysaccharide assembly protein LptE/RlpB